eukprot:16909-Heterococcus_DN1.PRE.2
MHVKLKRMHGDVISNVKSTVRWWNDTVQHGVAGLTAAAWSNAFPSLTTTLTAQPALAVSGSSSTSSSNTAAATAGVTVNSETASGVTVKSETVSSETADAKAAAAAVLTQLPAPMDVSPSRPPVRRTSTEMMAELNSLVARLAVNKGQRVSACCCACKIFDIVERIAAP